MSAPSDSPERKPIAPDHDAMIAAARASVAARLLANEHRLLAFIRQRLGTAAARERSADDVFATTLRRSDALVRANALLAQLPDAALLALASTISHRAILESSRAAARSERARESALDAAHARGHTADAATRGAHEPGASTDPEALDRLIRSELSEDDLAIIVLRLGDLDWTSIAAAIGTTPAGAHRRYYRALRALAQAAGKGTARGNPT